MKIKSEVLKKFNEYHHMVKTYHKKKIKNLRSYNGGEFRNEKFNKCLTIHGIQWQLIVPKP